MHNRQVSAPTCPSHARFRHPTSFGAKESFFPFDVPAPWSRGCSQGFPLAEPIGRGTGRGFWKGSAGTRVPPPPSSADALPIQVPEERAEGVPVRKSDAVPASWGVSLVGSLKPGGGHRTAGFAYDGVFGVAQDGLFHHWVEKRVERSMPDSKMCLEFKSLGSSRNRWMEQVISSSFLKQQTSDRHLVGEESAYWDLADLPSHRGIGL